MNTPKKHLGQHFLADARILARMVRFARPDPADTVIEIGPGTGTLTRVLAARVRRVIAIEADPDLIGALRESAPPNVEILEGDALDADFASLAPERCRVIANLPYNIATPLLDRFVRHRKQILGVTVLVQKEVADRVLASPGTRVYGPLSVGIRHYAIPTGGFVVSPGSFRPPPRVDSRLLRLDWREGVADAPGFRRFVGGAFSSRRKKLLNNLMAMYPERGKAALEAGLAACGLDPGIRAERLSPDEFFALWRAFAPEGAG